MTESSNTILAEELARTLRAAEVENFFMLTGGDQPMWIALRDHGIRMVVGRSEASSVYMADGYARASRKIGVTYGQAGPGAANVAASLADALWAQSPVMALTGATATNAVFANEYQALDQFSMFAAVTKWNGAAGTAQDAPRLLRHAMQMALTGDQGPTHLDVPKDFFGRSIERGSRGDDPLTIVERAPALDENAIDAALASLKKATKPMILVGEGVRFADAGASLAAFAERAGIPIVVTMGGKPSVLSGHVNFCGVVGRYSSVEANKLLAQADCVLAVGSRLGGLATNGYTNPSPKATIIQIDTNASAFANPYWPAVRIHADAGAALDALTQAITPEPGWAEWLGVCRAMAKTWSERLEARIEADAVAPTLTPFTVLAELRSYASEISLVADTGYMAAWTGVVFPVDRYDGFFRAVGSLGWALPASLGVQMARKEKVVCVIGDGGVGYHLADIETAVRYKLPVLVLVLNNSALAFEYHEQKYRWNGNVVPEANDFTEVDYAAAARALGADGRRIETREQLIEALAAGIASDRPCVLDIVIDREAFPPVTNFEAVLEREL
ncbi:thiamine pyrophosphate-binding protein [Nitratireductor soli]|uniref:thiamine pyrophosphate-binding protein n=1 Tax=Nitratireductor soli TaxID=1670619 RepID=UPI00065DEB21|nr:thiamine pyrophosphate-binding protein [Nitratireductor soli]